MQIESLPHMLKCSNIKIKPSTVAQNHFNPNKTPRHSGPNQAAAQHPRREDYPISIFYILPFNPFNLISALYTVLIVLTILQELGNHSPPQQQTTKKKKKLQRYPLPALTLLVSKNTLLFRYLNTDSIYIEQRVTGLIRVKRVNPTMYTVTMHR